MRLRYSAKYPEPTRNKISAWVNYVRRLIDDVYETETGISPALAALTPSSALYEDAAWSGGPAARNLDMDTAAAPAPAGLFDDENVDLEEADIERQVELARETVDGKWLDFYRRIVQFHHAEAAPLGLVVDDKSGLRVVVKAGVGCVSFIRGVTLAEEIYLIARAARCGSLQNEVQYFITISFLQSRDW
jgi:hypothetical protein